MKTSNFFKHIKLVIRHKHLVFIHCVKCGIPWRGVVHDLSKFSPSELFESAKYYNGRRSPIVVCREANGVSFAWLHHKGRNKHHIEYWTDDDCKVTPIMPYKYAVECFCDKVAATKVYKGKDYTDGAPLLHWEKYGNKARGNPRTMCFLDAAFRELAKCGERRVMNGKFLRGLYKEHCEDKKQNEIS